MKLRLLVLLVVLCAFTCALAFADSTEPVDSRLDQKVTYEAKGLALSKVLDELTEKTGVVMHCGTSSKDWQVRDRKVCIFAKDMPLGDVQKTLAKLLHFTWGRGQKDGAYTYRLFQDINSAKEEEALRNGEADAQAKKMADKRAAAIDMFDKLDAMTPAEIEKLKKDSPFQYMMATQPLGKSIGQMMRALPNAREAFMSGRDVTMPLSKLSSQGAGAASGLISAFDDLTSKMGPGNEPHSDLLSNLSNAQIKIRFPGNDIPTGMDDRGFLGTLEISAENQRSFNMPLMDPSSPMADLMATMVMRLASGESLDKVGADMQKEAMKVFSAASEAPNEPKKDEPKDPDLDKKVKLEGPVLTMLDAFAALAKKAELNVVSDYFAERRFMPKIPKTEGTLGEVLKSFAITYDKDYKKAGNCVSFQDKKWYEKRGWEVPEAWLDDWRAKAEAGKMTFEDVVAICCLSDAQITHTINTEKEIQLSTGFSLSRSKQVLRLYSALKSTEKSALQSEGGLDLSTLSDEQWAYVSVLEPSAEQKVTAGSKIALKMAVEEADPQGRTFTLQETPKADAGEEQKTSQLRAWIIPAPMHAPPAPKPVPDKPAKPAHP